VGRFVPSRVAAAVAVFVAAAAVAVPAFGWTFSGGNGANIEFHREVADAHTTETVYVYRNSAAPSSGEYLAGTFCTTTTAGTFYTLRNNPTTVTIPAMVHRVSVAVLPSNAYMVWVPSADERWFFGPGMAQPIYMSQYASTLPTSSSAVSVIGTVAAAITSMAADTTMSVNGTIPVDWWSGFTVESGLPGAVFALICMYIGGAVVWLGGRP